MIYTIPSAGLKMPPAAMTKATPEQTRIRGLRGGEAAPVPHKSNTAANTTEEVAKEQKAAGEVASAKEMIDKERADKKRAAEEELARVATSKTVPAGQIMPGDTDDEEEPMETDRGGDDAWRGGGDYRTSG